MHRGPFDDPAYFVRWELFQTWFDQVKHQKNIGRGIEKAWGTKKVLLDNKNRWHNTTGLL
jgi:hypothetical protein